MGRARPGPLSLPRALSWTFIITAGLWLALSSVFVRFAARANDIVLLGLTQIGVYALVLSWFGWSRRTELVDLLALRPTTLKVGLAAAALGATLQVPATLLSDAVEHFFPLPDAVLAERLARITPHSVSHGVLIFLVVAGLGPCVEEFFFRGALFGALRRGHGALVCVLMVSFCFALGHLDLRLLLPLFVAALVIGAVRELSGSIWPGFIVHAAFNSATLAVIFAGGAPRGKSPTLPALVALSGCVLTLALLVLLRRLALSSPVAQNARQRDVI